MVGVGGLGIGFSISFKNLNGGSGSLTLFRASTIFFRNERNHEKSKVLCSIKKVIEVVLHFECPVIVFLLCTCALDTRLWLTQRAWEPVFGSARRMEATTLPIQVNLNSS
jgi:hypothetical protein